MASSPPSLLSVLRNRVRRGQLIVGVGGFSATLGAILVAPIVVALVPRLQEGSSPWLALAAHVLLSRFWVYAVLPGLWLALSRWLRDLRPWRSAVGSALVGETFFLFLDWMGGGLRPGSAGPYALRGLTWALGVMLSVKAIRWRGQAARAASPTGVAPTAPPPSPDESSGPPASALPPPGGAR